MNKEIDLNEKFLEYFHEQESFSLRSERFYNEIDAKNLSKWLEAAFIQGARVMAQDSLDTLRQYATAMSGIDKPLLNTTQSFDSAADNLMIYYTRIFDVVDKDKQ